MGPAVLATGVFAGIALSLATLDSVARTVLTRSRPRLARAAVLAFTLAAMAALHRHSMPLARLLALPLLAAARWAAPDPGLPAPQSPVPCARMLR